MMIEKIQIYTAGCPRSQITEKNLRKALKQLEIEVEVESIDDPLRHQADGVEAFPSIRINGEVKSAGEFRTVDDCKEILSGYL